MTSFKSKGFMSITTMDDNFGDKESFKVVRFGGTPLYHECPRCGRKHIEKPNYCTVCGLKNEANYEIVL